tara:strand:+ start:291 stop:887 length:597 start_codon:yes stop_codon:yes gene_type:complete
MIISPKYKFAFILNPKSGCTSIYNKLKNIEDDEKIFGDLVPNDTKDLLRSKHTSCSELQKHHPQFDEYYKFAFVRNPWARVLSWYFFCKRSPLVERNTRNLSFEEFITIGDIKNIWANENFQHQYKFTKGCDFIGKTENLQSDFNTVCDKIGIPHIKLGYANKTKHRHYTEYYNWKTREIVANEFSDDIDYFDYVFGK